MVNVFNRTKLQKRCQHFTKYLILTFHHSLKSRSHFIKGHSRKNNILIPILNLECRPSDHFWYSIPFGIWIISALLPYSSHHKGLILEHFLLIGVGLILELKYYFLVIIITKKRSMHIFKDPIILVVHWIQYSA